MTRLRLSGFALAILLLLGCASYPEVAPSPDPLEPVNRGVFLFNRGLDRFALQPAANVWAVVTPQGFRLALDRFIDNLNFPVRLVSHLGRGQLRAGGAQLLRFAVNTGGGFFGFFDPATRIGLVRSNENLGDMFEGWGIPPGPYWVVPLAGPSNPRDGVGAILGSVLSPTSWISPLPAGDRLATSINRKAIPVLPYRSEPVDRSGYAEAREAYLISSTPAEEEPPLTRADRRAAVETSGPR